MKLRIAFTIDLSCLEPVLCLLRGFFAPRAACVVRWWQRQIHPLAPAYLHMGPVKSLSFLERQS